MRISDILLAIFRFLVPPALILPAYVYFYPVLQGCSFPVAKPAEAACYFGDVPRPAVQAVTAPFRLLTLADPQLEGDTSLPDPNAPLFPSVSRWREDGIPEALRNAFAQDLPHILQGYRKKVDLWGNDLYLAHVFRTVRWWTDPTHIVVLGDLLGSQWIDDGEFAKRSGRFWNVVFKGTERVPRAVTDVSGRSEVLGRDEAWRNRIMTVAGNHDIGYAGDIHEHRVERFEAAYGSINWELHLKLNDTPSTHARQWSGLSQSLAKTVPELHLTVLNSMNLDEPSWHDDLRQRDLAFLEEQLAQPSDPVKGRIILTHVPLHKEAGVCVDPPFFSYFSPQEGGGIREQNHLSEGISAKILGHLTAPSEHAIILNGHDHEGCDTYHSRSTPSGENDFVFKAAKWPMAWAERQNESIAGLREITVRSMMGSYGGNTGLLSAWFDDDAGHWRYEYDTCPFAVQHLWWGVHIFLLVELGLGAAGVCAWLLEWRAEERGNAKQKTA